MVTKPLSGRIALVAGATRGAGRAIAVALGSAGATVYCTGRSSRTQPRPPRPAGSSAFDTSLRPETIERTAELVSEAGGHGIAARVDHSDEAQVAALAERIRAEHGRLDVLVNDVWGGDTLAQFGVKTWELDIATGRALLDRGLMTHIITNRHCVPLVMASERGLILEITDGDSAAYRGTLFYDLVKSSVVRLAFALAEELREHGVAVVALTPGFLRSEAMLEEMGVDADSWRDGAAADPHFAFSESPAFVGRAVAALAADPDIMARTGTVTSSWHASRRYGFTDANGERPDWGRHASGEEFGAGMAESHHRFAAGFAEYEQGALVPADLADIERVLVYWFGDLDNHDDFDASKHALWWKGGEQTDEDIRQRFGDLHARALAGQLDTWRATPRGCLALIILLDQFTRSLGRGGPAAYAGDDAALAACLHAMDCGMDQQLRLVERGFAYMPLMHAEDRQIAERSVDTFSRLATEVAACEREDLPEYTPHAIQHADIVRTFGRFPHRNELLGRECTPEEHAYLADGAPTFGQKKK